MSLFVYPFTYWRLHLSLVTHKQHSYKHSCASFCVDLRFWITSIFRLIESFSPCSCTICSLFISVIFLIRVLQFFAALVTDRSMNSAMTSGKCLFLHIWLPCFSVLDLFSGWLSPSNDLGKFTYSRSLATSGETPFPRTVKVYGQAVSHACSEPVTVILIGQWSQERRSIQSQSQRLGVREDWFSKGKLSYQKWGRDY